MASGITCYLISNQNTDFVYQNHYLKNWDNLRNDKIALPTFKNNLANHEDFVIFNERYIRFYYPEFTDPDCLI